MAFFFFLSLFVGFVFLFFGFEYVICLLPLSAFGHSCGGMLRGIQVILHSL